MVAMRQSKPLYLSSRRMVDSGITNSRTQMGPLCGETVRLGSRNRRSVLAERASMVAGVCRAPLRRWNQVRKTSMQRVACVKLERLNRLDT